MKKISTDESKNKLKKEEKDGIKKSSNPVAIRHLIRKYKKLQKNLKDYKDYQIECLEKIIEIASDCFHAVHHEKKVKKKRKNFYEKWLDVVLLIDKILFYFEILLFLTNNMIFLYKYHYTYDVSNPSCECFDSELL